jgi:hypothetical protein
MSARKSYKIRSQETWDLIRAAYLGGETARVVARRFDVTPWAIERRASRESWTKKAWAQARAAASAPPPEAGRLPEGAPRQDEVDWVMTFPLAMGEAEAALRAGRGADAMRLMVAAEHYLKLRHRLEDVNRARAAQEAQQTPEAYWRAVADKAMVIANAMVVTGGGPAFMSRRTFAWRAQRLGPEVAAADFEKGRYGGWGSHYWNPDGTLKDPEGAGWTEDELKEMRRGAAL